jgi:hypothetical protein
MNQRTSCAASVCRVPCRNTATLFIWVDSGASGDQETLERLTFRRKCVLSPQVLQEKLHRLAQALR